MRWFTDGKVEPIVSLKDLRRASPPSMDVGPGDSLYSTREVGTQKIYSLRQVAVKPMRSEIDSPDFPPYHQSTRKGS
jgi:hypothetical protein